MNFKSLFINFRKYRKFIIFILVFSSFNYRTYPFPSYSIKSQFLFTNISKNLNDTSSPLSLHGFTNNNQILKTYGPLTLDINNIQFKSNIFFIPALNDTNKPLFIAINCNSSLLNVKDPKRWKGWFTPFFNYELQLLNDFCI